MLCTGGLTSEKHRLLGSIIPEIDCPRECFLCCEHHLGLKNFWERGHGVGQYDFQLGDVIECDGQCRQFTGSGCAVFQKRPLICRIFWKLEGELECHGHKRPERYLTHEEMRRIMWCWNYGTLQDARGVATWMKKEKK